MMAKITASPLGRLVLVASIFLLLVVMLIPDLRALLILLIYGILGLVLVLISIVLAIAAVLAIPVALLLIVRYIMYGGSKPKPRQTY